LGFGIWALGFDNGKVAVRQTIARLRAFGASVGGKSELHRAVRRVTPGQGNLTESGTENIPPAFVLRTTAWQAPEKGLLPKPEGRRRVRVKRCGKSAPRRR